MAPEGPLRVSVFESFGASWLSPRLPDFLARYPGVRLEVALDNRMVDLDAENVDVAVRIGKPADSSLHTRHLLTNRSLLVASPPIWPAMANPPIPPSWPTTTASFAAMGASASTGTSSRARAREGGGAGQPRLGRGHALLCAALAGCGVLLLSSWMVQQSIDEGTLLPLLPEWLASPTRIARTRSTRCFVAAASSNPRPAPSSTFWSRRSGPARAALTATGPPGETLKTQTPGWGPASEMRVATATAQRDFRPSGLGRAPR